MIDPETRYMQIDDVPPSEVHESPVQTLGAIGISDAIMTSNVNVESHTEAEHDRKEPKLLSLDNFIDAAFKVDADPIHSADKKLIFSKTIATNAWNVLTRLFTLKDNPEPFRRYDWFREDGYDYVPIVFNYVPKKDPHGRYSSFQLTELRSETIKPLLDLFDEELKKAGDDKFIEVRDSILGTAASKSVIELLRIIAKESDT